LWQAFDKFLQSINNNITSKYSDIRYHKIIMDIIKCTAINFLWGLQLVSMSIYAADPLSIPPNAENGISSYLILIIILIITIVVATVGLVIAWSKKQDEVNHLTFFCISHLILSSSQEEKCEAARALAQTKSPIALLVLIGIINDKEWVDEAVRKIAFDSLKIMAERFKRHKKLLNLIIPAIENKQHDVIIDLLIERFEKTGKKKYVQCAYVIGREYIYLEQYDEAKLWLERAEVRRNDTFYCTNEIDDLIELCNVKLYQQCDAIYQKEEYFQALECYSLTTQSLNEDQKHRFRSHLRIACTYCKLQRYSDAKQALLYALQYHEKTDYALKLNDLLNELPEIKTEQSFNSIEKSKLLQLNQYVDDIMHALDNSSN